VAGPTKGFWPAWLCIKYLVWISGGRAVKITPKTQKNYLEDFDFDGLILSGGADVNPALYKEKVLKTIRTQTQQINIWNRRILFSILIWLFRKLFSGKSPVSFGEGQERDRLEFELLRKALEHKIPILGICRGMQLINVYFGGSLHQDTKPYYVETPELHTVLPRQTIFIDPHSHLHSMIRKKFTRVNSLHYQSVNRVGDHLRIAAQDANGIVEALEHIYLPFVIGVQWHPEFLWLHFTQRRLFEKFVAQAKLAFGPVH
jgi:putative glutamine amidotransferase